MNEIKIQNPDYFGVIVGIICIAVICAGIIYYYRGADKQLERELDNAQRLNNQIASETRQLQTSIASHGAGIASIAVALGKSRKRIEHVYTEIEQSANDADRAIQVIEQCENIIKAVKAQR